MDKNFDKDLKDLALQLKSVCDQNGREVDISESSKIIHQIALLHFDHGTDKITVIKCVGLLNAAIVRAPTNAAEIEKDLSEVCQHILQQANAQNQEADLIAKATSVKSQIKSMRTEANQALKALTKNMTTLQNEHIRGMKPHEKHKVISIKKLQTQISSHYKQIMIDLSQYCVSVIGTPPCKFAIVGMGSLARKEITPYSDFEHIILLEPQSDYTVNLEYFRWFSVIFHAIILCVKETIIPTFNIKYLNDKMADMGDWFFDTRPSGVSFDGMMPHACKFPLGRTQPTAKKPWATELIKSVEEMLNYLSSSVDIKNGYHLSDVLTETCFVYADQTLHDKFLMGIHDYRNLKPHKEVLESVSKQVKKDMDKFATRIGMTNMRPDVVINVKQVFYRTCALFITALGKICGLKSCSCFDIINELAEKKKVSDRTKHKLEFAVAIACEIRLRTYSKEKSQRDYISPRENAETVYDEILEIIDKNSVISYMQITYCFQCEILELLDIKKSYTFSNEILLNVQLCRDLKMDKQMYFLLEKFYLGNGGILESSKNDLFPSNTEANSTDQGFIAIDKNMFFHFDKRLANLEENMFVSADSSLALSNPLMKPFLDQVVASFDPSSTSNLMSILKSFPGFQNFLLSDLMPGGFEISDFFETPEKEHAFTASAVTSFYGALSFVDLLDLSKWLLPTSSRDERLKSFRHSLTYKPFAAINDKIQAEFAKTLPHYLAEVMSTGIWPLFKANCLAEAKEFDEAIALVESTSQTCEKQDIGLLSKMIFNFCAGCSWYNLIQYDRSLDCLQTALGFVISEEFEVDMDDDNVDDGLYFNAILHSGVGTCLMELKHYQDALVHLKTAVQIIDERKLQSDSVKYLDILKMPFSLLLTYRNFSKCLIKTQKFEEALPFLYKAYELALYNEKSIKNNRATLFPRLLEQSHSKRKCLRDQAIIRCDIGLWDMKQNRLIEAVRHLQTSFDIMVKFSAEPEDMKRTRDYLLRCYLEINIRKKVENLLKNLLKAGKKISGVVPIDTMFLTYSIHL